MTEAIQSVHADCSSQVELRSSRVFGRSLFASTVVWVAALIGVSELDWSGLWLAGAPEWLLAFDPVRPYGSITWNWTAKLCTSAVLLGCSMFVCFGVGLAARRSRRRVRWTRRDSGDGPSWVGVDAATKDTRHTLPVVEHSSDSEAMPAWSRRPSEWEALIFPFSVGLSLLFGIAAPIVLRFLVLERVVRPPFVDHTLEPSGLRWSGILRRDRFFPWSESSVTLSRLSDELWVMRIEDDAGLVRHIVVTNEGVAFVLDRLSALGRHPPSPGS